MCSIQKRALLCMIVKRVDFEACSFGNWVGLAECLRQA